MYSRIFSYKATQYVLTNPSLMRSLSLDLQPQGNLLRYRNRVQESMICQFVKFYENDLINKLCVILSVSLQNQPIWGLRLRLTMTTHTSM